MSDMHQAILEVTKLKRQLFKLLKRQVIALVQFLPIETMLTSKVADRIDKNDHERWCLHGSMLYRPY